MNRSFRLSAPVWGKCDVIRLSVEFEPKRGGYFAWAQAVEHHGNSWSKVFDANYFQYGDGYFPLVSAGRRSAKRLAEAENMLQGNAPDFVRRYLEKLGKTELTIQAEI